FDLSLFRFGSLHVAALAHLPQDLSRVIFMEHAFLLLPYIEMFFSHGKQHRDILFCHRVALAEDRVFHHAGMICVISWQRTLPTASSVLISFIRSPPVLSSTRLRRHRWASASRLSGTAPPYRSSGRPADRSA